MLKRIINEFENISNVARGVIKGGVVSATLLMSFAIYYIMSPSRTLAEKYLSEGLGSVAVTIFAEVVVLSLLSEAFAMRIRKN